jgi:hypothetical protein
MCALPIRSKLGMPSRNSGSGQSFGGLAAVRMGHQQIAAGRARRALEVLQVADDHFGGGQALEQR